MSENALLILLALVALVAVKLIFKTLGYLLKTALLLVLAYAVYYFFA